MSPPIEGRVDDAEHLSDILDVGSRAAQAFVDSSVDRFRVLAAPEQDGTESECRDCGADLGARQALFRCRCITCQELLERERGSYGRG